MKAMMSMPMAGKTTEEIIAPVNVLLPYSKSADMKSSIPCSPTNGIRRKP